MYEITMPKLGLDMEAGTILSWHKHEEDRVEQGEVLFAVETDKVTMDIEAPHAGYLRKILRQAGEQVQVNVVVAYVGELQEAIPDSRSHAAPVVNPPLPASVTPSLSQANTVPITPAAKEIAQQHHADVSRLNGTALGGRIGRADVERYLAQSPQGKDQQRIKISPAAKKMCREFGIDYQTAAIQGSAPNGRILRADVLAYYEAQQAIQTAQTMQVPTIKEVAPTAPKEAIKIRTTTPLTGIRKVIAERMSRSKQTIPHIILNAKADVTALVALRERLKAKVTSVYGVKLTYTDILLKICASALREHREINVSLHDQTCIMYEDINIGFAVAVGNNLVVPTLYHCDKLSLLEITRQKTALVAKAKQETLQLTEISNGTFTLTNLGMFRIRSSSPIINPPQAAILAVGEIYQEPAVVNNEIGIRSFMELSLACDHRLIDGVAGAKFLQHIVARIEEPEMLIL
jgi:pyruvate dehydrogenase E2 component (dihydrolipoamide acetyltransferase)